MIEEAVLPELAAYVLGPLDLSEDVLHAGRRTLLNAVALGIGAAHHPAAEAACQVVSRLSRAQEASILGRPDRVDAEWAAFVGGIAVHAEDYDDTHLATVVHPGAPVVPAALALAEMYGSSGCELLEAVVVGVEMACRVGLALGSGHFERGWHLTGSTGRFGAAAAAARLAGLETETLTGVWARCAAETAGVQAAFGAMTKPYHAGKAAYDSIRAIRDAAQGRSHSPLTAADEARWSAGLGPDPDLGELTADLGTRWEICDNTFKPYACGIVSHPVIDAAIEARSADPGVIEQVTVTVNPIVLDVMGVEEPATGLQSKFSVYHCAAVGLIDGIGGPPQFSDERVAAPEIVEFRRKVRVLIDPALPRDSAALVAEYAGGRSREVVVEHARGSAARPMTDGDLAAKARASMLPVVGAAADNLIGMLFSVDSHQTRDLVRLARPVQEP